MMSLLLIDIEGILGIFMGYHRSGRLIADKWLQGEIYFV